MDWSIGAGYSGLYANTNKREGAKQELATLTLLNNQVRQEKADQEAAQLKEQAYYEQISKYADTLLAPDRARINQKAQSMSSLVRNHVKLYGGDMQKFFENGGHRIMGDYKSSIINSEESSQYLENKKNMERILDMQQKGLGHLINPTDMFNLQKYQSGEGRKISYTGQLLEVKMPDTNTEIWGKEITADRILHHEGNYAKFYANYKLTYPDADDPTEKDLLMFVANQHSDILGTNWQKPMQERQQAFNEYKDKRDYDRGVLEEDRNYKMEKEKHDLDMEKEMIEALNQYGFNKDETNGTYVDSQGNTVTKEGMKDTYSVINSMETSSAQINAEVGSISDIKKSAEIIDSNFGADLPYNLIGHREDADQGSGSTALGKKLLNNYYQLRESKLIYTGQEAERILADKGLFEKPGEDGRFKIDLSKNPDLFSADGTKISNWSADNSLKPKSNILTGGNFANEISKTSFEYGGVVTGFVAKDKQGKDVIVTNVVDNGHNWVVNKGKTANLEKRYKMDSKPDFSFFVQVKNEKGQVFYKRIEGDLNKSIFASLGNSEAITNARNVRAKAEGVQDKKKEKRLKALQAVEEIKSNPSRMNTIKSQIQTATGVPNGAILQDAALSFYLTLTDYNKGSSIDDHINSKSFYEAIKSATDTPESKARFDRLMRSPNLSSANVVEFIIKETEFDYGNEWRSSLTFVQQGNPRKKPTHPKQQAEYKKKSFMDMVISNKDNPIKPKL